MKITCNGISVNYEISGSGSVVMFAHSLGSDLSIWEAQKSALAGRLDGPPPTRGRHTVLTYDLRGHGQTEASAGAYDFNLLAADAIALLDALKIDKASFVGISLGGMIGQALALAAPQRLGKLVLADTTGHYPPEAQALWPERIRQIEARGLEPLVGPTLERWFTAPYRAAHPALVARIGTLIRNTPVAGYIGCCHAIAALDFTERLKTLNLPTLVMVGDQDVGTPPAMARELAAAIPGAQLEIIPGAAHLSNIEQADAFNRQLLAFLGD
jgi:3-oxoadipate enol-lactonase